MDNKTTHPQTMAERFADVLRIQKAEAERDLTDTYMVGLYNGMLMMCCNADNTDDYRPIKAQMKETVPAPQREWVGLTDEERQKAMDDLVPQRGCAVIPDVEIAHAIEAALKEKNT